jgi:hypothetical protein
MTMINSTEKELLLKAIDNAQRPGDCMYVCDGQPCCVIGQYAHLKGVPVYVMNKWEGKFIRQIIDYRLRDIPLALLTSLQMIWDRNNRASSEEDRKHEMTCLVNSEMKFLENKEKNDI